MKRRAKKQKKGGSAPTTRKEESFNSPFGKLKKLVNLPRVPSPKPSRGKQETNHLSRQQADQPEATFLAAVAGVVKLADGPRRVDRVPTGGAKAVARRNRAEANALFAELLATSFRFDISDSEEYMEGAVVGLDPRLVRRLRRGEFSYQDHIDLHGMTADEARKEVGRFITHSILAGFRCVLIIHGRGRNSLGQWPVLKHKLKQWLSSGAHARAVLAFTTARPVDGGAGALYLLLRRQRRKKHHISVLEGAKR